MGCIVLVSSKRNHWKQAILESLRRHLERRFPQSIAVLRHALPDRSPMRRSTAIPFFSYASTTTLLDNLSNFLLTISLCSSNTTAIMGYEESVYLAKLAEQAERYEG